MWYSLEPPRQGGSNGHLQSMFEQKYEKCLMFLTENVQFLEVKFSIYLHRRFFVMCARLGTLPVVHLFIQDDSIKKCLLFYIFYI